MKNKLFVIVTGVGGRSVGHQILQALLLTEDRYRIVATDADAFSFGLFQADKKYLVPPASKSDYLESVLRLIRKESAQVILPGTEIENEILITHESEIKKAGCTLIANPEEVIKLCANKWRLFNWLNDNGFGTPLSVREQEWKDLVAKTGFPIVGKPTESTGGSKNVALLNSDDEVAQYLQETGAAEIIFQEYVGSGAEEYTVGVLISNQGNIIDSIVMHRKLTGLSLGSERTLQGRSYSLSTGYSQGFIIDHPLIRNTCEKLVLKLGMRGPANIQCRLEKNEVKIFEVHPRFSGTSSIRALAGFNEPDILIRNFVHGETFGRIDYQVNVAAIRAFQNLLIPIADIKSLPRA